MLAPIDGIAVDAYRNLAGDRELEAGRGDDDVGVEMLAGLQLDAALVETLDMIGDDRRLARLHRLEKIGVGDEAQPLIPRVVGRGEGDGVIAVAERGLQRGRAPCRERVCQYG